MAITVEAVSAGALNTAILIGSVVFVGAIIIFIVYMYMNYKRYDTVCIIIERAAGGIPLLSRDMGGIYVEKRTNNKRFFLKASNAGLDPDNIPYIMNTKGQKIVYLLKTGLKNFRYLDLNVFEDYNFKITVGEEDVNWALNAYERHKKVFGSTLLEKLLPYIGIAMMGVFILGMIVVVLKEMGVLKEVAIAFADAARAFSAAKSGTTIIT